MLSNVRLKFKIALLLLTAGILTASPFSAGAAFNARLQGQSRGSSAWIGGNLQGWRDLDLVPCRLYLTGGPANNKTIVVEFDRMQGRNPGIEDLVDFTPSANVVLVSQPRLSVPAGSSRWSYTFTITLKDRNPGWVRYNARLAVGAHLNGGSSVAMRGSPSLGNLQIHKIAPAACNADLSVVKTGPAQAAPGEIIIYTLQYSNKLSSPTKSISTRLTDALPPNVTAVPETIGNGRISGASIVWDLPNLKPGDEGRISFKVRVNTDASNGQLLTNSACITSACPDPTPANNKSSVITRIVIIETNRPPLANPDAYQGLRNQTIVIPAPGVLANDADPDGNPLTAILITPPSNGTVTLAADGSFQYIPANNFSGTDTFIYKANDGAADSQPATVTMIVPAPENHLPVANPDNYTTARNITLIVPARGVLANDTDPDGNPLTAILVTVPINGTVTLNADGSFQYVPANNFSGTATFAYKANDGLADSQPAIVTITVPEPENLPPTVNLLNPTNGAIYIEGMHIPLVADAFDQDGTIARVDFFASSVLLGNTTETPYRLLLTNVPAGEYVFRAGATDDDGASALSAPANVMVLEYAPYAAGPFTLNRQTGLFEQTVTIFNPTPVAIPAIRLWIIDVRSGATVWNATATYEGIPCIDLRRRILAAGSIEALIEYYTPDIRVPPEPRFLPELLNVDGASEVK